MFRLGVLLVMFRLGLTLGFQGLHPPRVTTRDGSLKGTHLRTRGGRLVAGFLSIPYAKPPVGNLRFMPPQPVEPWLHERPADSPPVPCTQPPLHLFSGIAYTSSEDCLYLNVYTPKVLRRRFLPVIFYIVGGGFQTEVIKSFTPDFLLDEDVLFVTVQYRIQFFGFLSTNDEVVPGNMGFKDQRLALRWVRDNIRYFGGDPDKVTIFGESAGANSVHYHMIFSAQEGLFRAAICHSGSALASSSFWPPAEVKAMTASLSALSGCPRDSVGFVECLQRLPLHDLLLLYQKCQELRMGNESWPGLNDFLPLSAVLEPEGVEDRFISGNPWNYSTTIPFLAGVNSNEALLFLSGVFKDRTDSKLQEMESKFNSIFPNAFNYQYSVASGSHAASAIRDFYLHNQPISRQTAAPFSDAISDVAFVYGVYAAAVQSSRRNTYVFINDYIEPISKYPVSIDLHFAASHGEELCFFFPLPGCLSPYRLLNTSSDTILSKKLVKMWVNFVTYLDPTPKGSGEFHWTTFHPKKSYLHITQDKLVVRNNFLQERMAFWQSTPYPGRDDNYESSKQINICYWQLPDTWVKLRNGVVYKYVEVKEHTFVCCMCFEQS